MRGQRKGREERRIVERRKNIEKVKKKPNIAWSVIHLVQNTCLKLFISGLGAWLKW
jgi:hypothetical protein